MMYWNRVKNQESLKLNNQEEFAQTDCPQNIADIINLSKDEAKYENKPKTDDIENNSVTKSSLICSKPKEVEFSKTAETQTDTILEKNNTIKEESQITDSIQSKSLKQIKFKDKVIYRLYLFKILIKLLDRSILYLKG